MKSMHKIVKDCIYGHIAIPPLCCAFMDVPEFQRLRRVRQTGTPSHYVYPSANSYSIRGILWVLCR